MKHESILGLWNPASMMKHESILGLWKSGLPDEAGAWSYEESPPLLLLNLGLMLILIATSPDVNSYCHLPRYSGILQLLTTTIDMFYVAYI